MSNNNLTKIGYIPREVEEEIKKYLSLPQIIALLGPRRSGKTTLLLHLKNNLENAVYLSFEDPEVLDLFEKDIKGFAKLYLNEKTKYLFIDEFHYAKSGGKQLKYLFDYYHDKKIIISGSSSPELTIKALKYLVGRVITFTLYPFSFSEFLYAKDPNLQKIWKDASAKELVDSPLAEKILHFFEEYLIFGGYPEVVIQDDFEIKKKLLKNIYGVLFLREVKDFLNLVDDFKLRNLIKALALQIGNLINYHELSLLTGLDFKTLKRYLNFLEKVFICSLVSPFFTNKRKELVKAPKIYFWDLGLVNAITDNFSLLEQRVNQGAILENAAFIILAKQNEVKFWRSKAKAEVDFVLEKDNEVLPIEIKSAIKTEKIPLSLQSLIKTYHPKKAIVVTLSFFGKKKFNHTQILFQPLWKLDFSWES